MDDCCLDPNCNEAESWLFPVRTTQHFGYKGDILSCQSSTLFNKARRAYFDLNHHKDFWTMDFSSEGGKSVLGSHPWH
jgi:uncharacterized protein (DUF1810 family)